MARSSTNDIRLATAVLIDGGISDLDGYVSSLRDGGLGEVLLATTATQELHRFVTADAVIVMCHAWSDEAGRVVSAMREADSEGRVCIVIAARALDTHELGEAKVCGADGVILLTPPSRQFYRQIAAVIQSVRRRRS